MRISILTQYYPPEMGAPQARLSHLANSFIEQNHEVVVITAMPNYPTGKYYKGYSGIFRFEKEGKLLILRCHIYPTKSLNIFLRMFSYLSFVFSSLVIGILFIPKSDYLIVESPPLFLGMTAIILSRLKNIRLIFNVSDLWPDSAVYLNMIKAGKLLYAMYWLEALCYRKAWMITGQSLEIIQSILYRFPDLKTYHLSNGVDADQFSPERCSEVCRKKMARNQSLIILYAGLHGLAQDLNQIIQAAAEVHDHQVIFVFIGDGPEKISLMNMTKQLKLKNVKFLDPAPKTQMPEIVASADIALIPLKKHIPGAVPSKLYESMGSGVPVILIAEGESVDIVKKYRCGIVIKPNDIEQIIKAIQNLSKDSKVRKEMGRRGREAALQQFNRNDIALNFVRYLETCCNSF
ncbi:glycosyltransferase family 4 protein [bacterium]|nr:glycosyltransferase family 4 protein [bacterium]